MAQEISLTDPTFQPVEQRGWLARMVLQWINDERDLPFVWLSLGMTFVLIPFAVYLYLPGRFHWLLAVVYWAVLFGVYFDRYILMLHNTSHRRLFKRKYSFVNNYIPWILGPFCGETPETYFVHHITMHHAEGNMPADLSSTMKYQRDSFVDFLRYFFDFFFLTMAKLVSYQMGKKRMRLVRLVLVGELGFYAALGLGMWLNWRATTVVFLVPFLMCRFLMMCGNWGQHAFINAEEPQNSYVNSITCINCRYNQRCFNDGYHIGHHVAANRHWTEMPEDFQNNRNEYLKQGAIVFEGIDFFIVWLLLMTKQYKALAKRFVDLNETRRSEEEIVNLLKERTKRIAV
jgi:fatty acid desaturase